MKILIADDIEQNLYMLQKLLEGHGYEVVSATNGAEALEKARRDPPDLIISDILMPVMDGFSLCCEWKKDNLLKEIPLIFYTATYTDEKDEILALQLGASKFIRKPIEPDDLIKIVKSEIVNVKATTVAPKEPTSDDKRDVYKLYSERLVKKLEQKMLDLEREIAKRKRAEEELAKHRDHLEVLVKERTDELTKLNQQLNQQIEERKKAGDELKKRTDELQAMVNLMAGREVRMAELKKMIKKLRSQLEEAGMKPVADDPLKEAGYDYT